jgi:hypothetical protein
MGNYRRRTSYESDHVLSSKAVARRKVRTTIGEELRRLYEVPRKLAHGMLTLLVRVKKLEGE